MVLRIILPALIFVVSNVTKISAQTIFQPDVISYIPFANLGVRDLHTDCEGNIIYVGGTSSNAFTCTPGTINSNYLGGNSDAFIVKVDSSGNLLWSTLIGGNLYDRAYAVEIDAEGFIYVAGRAGTGLQTTQCALQQNFTGDNTTGSPYGIQDGFLAKITPDGSTIVWCTYVGCGGGGFIRDIDLDTEGNIWLGMSDVAPDLPYITANAIQQTATNASNCALVKVSSDGRLLLFGTFMADGVHSGGRATVRVDKNHENAVWLLTHASANSIPVTPQAFQPLPAGSTDFVVSRFDVDGNLLFCSFLGGSGIEEVETHSLEIDSHGNGIVAAYTFSSDYPVVGQVFQTNFYGSREGVITKIDLSGDSIIASTYLGGTLLDEIEGVGIDANDVIYVTGTTQSTNFPVTVNTAYQAIHGGSGDGHITIVAADLSTILYSTFVGGSGADQLRCCHVDEWGKVHGGGAAGSANYPVFNPFSATLTGTTTAAAATLRPEALFQPGLSCVITNEFDDPCITTFTSSDLKNLITAYPNPASGLLSIYSTNGNEVKGVELIDIQGRVIKSGIELPGHFDVSFVPQGIYFLRVHGRSGQIFQKIIIQH